MKVNEVFIELSGLNKRTVVELNSFEDGDISLDAENKSSDIVVSMYIDRDSAYALYIWLGEHMKRTEIK